MKTNLVFLFFAFGFALNVQANAPLGGGTFQGQANWTCFAEAGTRCNPQAWDRSYSVTVQLTDDSFVWSAQDAFGNVVWNYTMDLTLISTTPTLTHYEASIDDEKLGEMTCDSDHCDLRGRGSCELSALCDWGLVIHKGNTGSLRFVSWGVFHVMDWDNSQISGTIRFRQYDHTSRTDGWFHPAPGAKIPAVNGLYYGFPVLSLSQ